MTLTLAQQLQALRHAAADVRDESEVCGLPFDSDPVLQLFHRRRVMSVHASLEVAPQILDRIEVRTPCGPVDEVDAVGAITA